MERWYRVFGTRDAGIEPAALLSALSGHVGHQVTGRFRGDELGWFEGELGLRGTRLELQRYLAAEDDLRDELNTWAAWLESQEDQAESPRLMRHMIATAQLFAFRLADRVAHEDAYLIEELCTGLCQLLARATDGIYQLDGKGFFDADGMLLVAENENPG
jgi:hypothetical protein